MIANEGDRPYAFRSRLKCCIVGPLSEGNDNKQISFQWNINKGVQHWEDFWSLFYTEWLKGEMVYGSIKKLDEV